MFAPDTKLTGKMRLAMRPILREDITSGACDGEHDGALVESQYYWIGGGCMEATAILMLGIIMVWLDAPDRFIR